MFPIGGDDGAGCFSTGALFLLLAAPFIIILRTIGKLARVRYGFADPIIDDGPPIRICTKCHNTVLEEDYAHCPYCGELLPERAEPLEQPGQSVLSEIPEHSEQTELQEQSDVLDPSGEVGK